MLGACTERTICPAYQSAFIHDEKALTARFSYFKEDTTPKIREVDKSRYLIVNPVAYKKRVREMRSIPMIDIYPVPDDSVAFDEDMMYAERDVLDTAQLTASAKDTLHPGLKGPFNIDQELYMYYLQDILLLPDARAQMDLKYDRKKKKKKKKEKKEEEGTEEEKEKKGPFSIFKKKDKKDKESEEEKEEGEESEEEEDTEEESPPDEDNKDF